MARVRKHESEPCNIGELDSAAWAVHVLRAREDDQRFGAEGAANERAARVYVIDHGEVHGPVRGQSSRVSLSASMLFRVKLGKRLLPFHAAF
jgi:hypothetical protein